MGEEDEMQVKWDESKAMEDDVDELDEEQQNLVDKIRKKRKLIIAKRTLDKSNNKPILPRTAVPKSMEEADEKLSELGLDTSKLKDRATKTLTRGRKRTRSTKGDEDDEDMEGKGDKSTNVKLHRSQSRGESVNRRDASKPRDSSSYRNPSQQREAAKMAKKVQKKLQRNCKVGEADRHVFDEKPKHLFSGKRGI